MHMRTALLWQVALGRETEKPGQDRSGEARGGKTTERTEAQPRRRDENSAGHGFTVQSATGPTILQ
eukprot:1422596-Pyramimonas_sp.AAC.1